MMFGIPKTTLNDWKKKEKDNWRFRLYSFLSKFDEAKVTDAQIQINQRFLALKYVFGENTQHYKFEILDTIFKNNPDLLQVNFEDCEKDAYINDLRNKILNELKKMKITADVKSAMYLINKADCIQYMQIIYEYKLWLNQKKGVKSKE